MLKNSGGPLNPLGVFQASRVSAGILYSFLMCRLAHGQDALTRALSLEPVITPTQTAPVDLRPEQPHLGPVQLTLGLYAGTEANDNIYYTETNLRSDLLLHAGINLGFLWPLTDQSELRFGAGLGYVHYARTPHNDHLEVAPDSVLTWAIGFDDGTLTIFDQVSYSQSVASEAAIAGLALFPRFENTIGARLDWLPGRWVLAAGYSHDTFLSDSAQFNYLDRSSEFFFGRGGWRFAEKTQLGLEASASLVSYRLPLQPGNQSISVGPYLEWQFTQSLRATLRGGSVTYLFDTPQKSLQGSTLDSYYLGLEINQQLTDFLSHRVSVQRDVRQGVNQGGSYIEDLTAAYSISYALTGRISVAGALMYEQGRQPFDFPVDIFPLGQVIVETLEDYSRYGVGPSISWRATDKLSAALAYQYWLRTSNLSGHDYVQNVLSLNLTYTF